MDEKKPTPDQLAEFIRIRLLPESERMAQEPGEGELRIRCKEYIINGKKVFFVGTSHFRNFEDTPEGNKQRSEYEAHLIDFLSNFRKETGLDKVTFLLEDIGAKDQKTEFGFLRSNLTDKEKESIKSSEPKTDEILQQIFDSKITQILSVENEDLPNLSDSILLYYLLRGGKVEIDEKNLTKYLNIIFTCMDRQGFKYFDMNDPKILKLYEFYKILDRESIKQELEPNRKDNIDILNRIIKEKIEHFVNNIKSAASQESADDQESANDIETLVGPNDCDSLREKPLQYRMCLVANEVITIRDIELTKEVLNQTSSEHNHVFILYGLSHEIRLRPVMEDFASLTNDPK
jgi:hypothetical protein